MSKLHLARNLINRMVEAIAEIQVSYSFTLATVGELLLQDERLDPVNKVAAWQFVERLSRICLLNHRLAN